VGHERGELHTVSGRQWLHLGSLRVRIPSLLAGRAVLREWQREDGALGTTLTIHNPLLGHFVGWRGFSPNPKQTRRGANVT
jgi:hypothetical protein